MFECMRVLAMLYVSTVGISLRWLSGTGTKTGGMLRALVFFSIIYFLHLRALWFATEFPLCCEKVLPVFLAQVLTSMIVPEAWAST